MTEQELKKCIMYEIDLAYSRGTRHEPIHSAPVIDRILNYAKETLPELAKRAGYKSPEEVVEIIITVEQEARKFGWQSGLEDGRR